MGLNPKVFVSYAHGDETHVDRVFRLSEKLLEWGIDSSIDQYQMDPNGGWPRWMDEQIEQADYVLIVSTELYLKRFELKETPGSGKGVKWKAQSFCKTSTMPKGKTQNSFQSCFRKRQGVYPPATAELTMTYYTVETKKGFERLYRRLTGQPEVAKGRLWKLRVLSPVRRSSDRIYQAVASAV